MRFYHAVDLLRNELSEDVFQELIYLYLSDLKKNFEYLEKAVNENNRPCVVACIQCLKEVSFNMGITPLYEELLNFESNSADIRLTELNMLKEQVDSVLTDFSV